MEVFFGIAFTGAQYSLPGRTSRNPSGVVEESPTRDESRAKYSVFIVEELEVVVLVVLARALSGADFFACAFGANLDVGLRMMKSLLGDVGEESRIGESCFTLLKIYR